MADTEKDPRPKGHQSGNTPIISAHSNTDTVVPSFSGRNWISPASAQTKQVEKKSIITRQIEDEIALDQYTKANTTPKKKTNHNLVIGISIVVILGFIFTLGGNLVDLATGGDGSHSWYGKNGVYDRFMSGYEDNNRASSETDTNLTESLKNNKQVISNSAPSNTKTHTEVRLLNPPKNEVAVKPLPAQSYKAADFLSSDLKVHCRISNVVECTIIDFKGQLGQKPGHTIAITLAPTGVDTPKDLGIEDSLNADYSLSAGATATSGDYACTATDSTTIDCWNLKTGSGMVVSQNSAQAYRTKYTTSSSNSKKER